MAVLYMLLLKLGTLWDRVVAGLRLTPDAIMGWAFGFALLFSGMGVTGCAATRGLMDRLMGNHHTHNVRIDLDPLRDWIDDAEDAANDRMRREAENASR